MLHHLATLALGPVFLLQGRRVRRVTPRLPEAHGPRTGMQGDGPELRLLILGDSAAAGVGVASQQQALSGQLVGALANQYCVHWALVAETGLDAAALLTRLRAEPAAPFDVVVLSVGVNDVTGMTGARQWRRYLDAIVLHLQHRHQAKLILISEVPPMHHFPALPQPLRWWLGQRARVLNAIARRWVSGQHHCQVIALDLPFESRYMASDGFHPGAAAYTHWAQTLAQVILRRQTHQAPPP